MRMGKVLSVLAMSVLLSACVGALVAKAGTQLLLSLMKPMVGFDPNAGGLFEQPLIKDRMVAFLGPQYEPAMQLIKTADTLQQEGPLFYVVSRYTPVPELAEKAGFVWNSETNQMALMLVTGGSPTVIAEKIVATQTDRLAEQLVPQWPGELQSVLDASQDASALQQKALDAASQTAEQALIPQIPAPHIEVPQIEVPQIGVPHIDVPQPLDDAALQQELLQEEKKP
jgi:hypothetical protein